MNGGERDRLDVIEAKLDLLIERASVLQVEFLRHRDGEQAGSHYDHEKRLRSVERWKLSIPVSVLLALATFLGIILKGGA